ncbi:MAG: TolB family protein, partial [Gemmatimonadaceae bacterium]
GGVMTLRLALAASLVAAGCDGATGPGDQSDGRPIVYVRLDNGPGWTLYQVSSTGGTPTRLRPSLTGTLYPAVSRDGSRLAFVSESDPAGVYVSAADGSGARLVYNRRAVEHIAWSPDGTRLALGVPRWASSTGHGEIVVVGADGTGEQTITETVAIDASYPSWSPRGRIAFTSAEFGFVSDIYTMAPDGSDVRRIVDGEGNEARDPAWSPDGSHLAFALGRFGSSSIFTVDANGNDRRRVTPEPEWGFGATDLGPVWSPSGRWIAFQRERSVCEGAQCQLRYDVYVVRSIGGELRNITAGSPWGGVRPSW